MSRSWITADSGLVKAILIFMLLLPLSSTSSSGEMPEQSAAFTAEAGAPVGSPFRMENPPDYDLTNPAVAYDSFLDWYWVTTQVNSIIQKIYVTILKGKFEEMFSWPLFVALSGQTVGNPDIAYSPFPGYFLIVWEHFDGTYNRIKGRLTSASGPISDEILLGTSGANDYKPAVAFASGSNKFLVVWERVVWMSGTSDIEGQVVAPDGTLVGSKFLVATGDNQFAHYEPDLAYNPSLDHYLVVWSQEYKPNSEGDIYGRRVAANGALVDPTPIPIGYYVNNETAPAVAALQTPSFGKYLVAWELHLSGADHDIYACAVSGTGATQTDFPIATAIDMETNPAIASNHLRNQYLVTWTAPIPGFTNTAIWGRPVEVDGSYSGETAYFNGLLADHSAVSAGRSGDYLVAYQDSSLFPAGIDLWGSFWGDWIFLPLVQQ